MCLLVEVIQAGGQLAILGSHFCSPYRGCTVAKYDSSLFEHQVITEGEKKIKLEAFM